MKFFAVVGLLVFALPTLCVYALALRAQKFLEAQFALVKES